MKRDQTPAGPPSLAPQSPPPDRRPVRRAADAPTTPARPSRRARRPKARSPGSSSRAVRRPPARSDAESLPPAPRRYHPDKPIEALYLRSRAEPGPAQVAVSRRLLRLNPSHWHLSQAAAAAIEPRLRPKARRESCAELAPKVALIHGSRARMKEAALGRVLPIRRASDSRQARSASGVVANQRKAWLSPRSPLILNRRSYPPQIVSHQHSTFF